MGSSDGKQGVDVAIGGKVYTLTGDDSEEFLQRIATYINGKLSEYGKMESFRRLSVETQNIYMFINLADDCLKARQKLEEALADLEKCHKEEYDLKHNLVVTRTKNEALERNLKDLTDEINESQKKIIKLEAELGRKNESQPQNSRKPNAGR